LNIFSVGFPVSILAGFFVVMATLPSVAGQLTQLLGAAFELLRGLTGV
jgi:flagellar biosynthetic protein FliR